MSLILVRKSENICTWCKKSNSHYVPQPYTNQSVFKSLLSCTSEIQVYLKLYKWYQSKAHMQFPITEQHQCGCFNPLIDRQTNE